tara:strand:- start:59270 stop:60586 length:1317 start_codon:yes stop_codon:yes gene_type:complete
MKLICLLFITLSVSIQAKSIKDFSPFDYEVLFTNPVCKTYYYDTPLETNAGDYVKAKTKNAYCKSSDSSRSQNRKNSPHKRMLEWINDSNTKEVFLSYLSFSKRSIAKALCNGVKKRNLKVTFIIDSNNESDDSRMATANYLANCEAPDGTTPIVLTRGGEGRGRDKVGYAHNKIIIVNPNSKSDIRIGFGSGNMSSGISTHHENWHFITTNAQTNFAQSQLCLMEGTINHASSKSVYSAYISKCRALIKNPVEDDIKSFFVPGEGNEAMNAIAKEVSKSDSVKMAAHRFSNGKLIGIIGNHLKKGKTAKLVVDDDIYWTGVYKRGMGRNMYQEYSKVRTLQRAGMDVHYVETSANDIDEPTSLQLQHNKFLIFTNKNSGSVFTGAGNLTSSAFSTNFENFYLISIPEVHTAFTTQYENMWNNLSKSYWDMPKEYQLP